MEQTEPQQLLTDWELDNIQASADRAAEMGFPYADWFYKLLDMARLALEQEE